MRRTRSLLALAALVAPMAFTSSTPTPTPPSTGEQVVAAMHDRYAATWYHTLTFVQRSIWYKADGSEARVQTWHEAASMPGKLRIDIGDSTARNGAIYRSDSTYDFSAGKLSRVSGERNPLLILGFDVYAQSAAHTDAVLREEGVDLSKFHRDTFQGRPVYVVGALAGDTTSTQFWVDGERLLFVRLIQPNRAKTNWQDIRFNRYVPEPGGWLAIQVQVLTGGRVVYAEEYSDVRVNDSLNPELWNPQAWQTVPLWWR
ncbi:MAG TPA: hypothetical protein VIJ16_02895 [Gemmatimonadaceae bacterium]